MSAQSAGRRWLFGPVSDLAFGCGALYTAVFGAQALLGADMRVWLPITLQPFLTLALGAPHYGATLLRTAQRSPDGGKHVFFALWTGLLMIALLVLGLRQFWIGSLLVTLYVTWSPWHYSAQNYGVAVAFLRRRGVDLEPGTKRVLRGAFVSSYLLTVVALHGARAEGYAPVSYRGTVFTMLPVGLPANWMPWLYAGLGAIFLACSAVAGARLLRRAGARALDAPMVLWVTQTLWFVVPPLARYWDLFGGVDPLAPENAPYTVMWVAVFHFVQYLWITTYQAAGTSAAAGRAAYLGKALLAGAALWMLPPLVFAPGVLGGVPFDLGLGVLAAALVNLHHFVLDGVIWKTSPGPVARLVRADWTPHPLFEPRPLGWLRPLGVAIGIACVAIGLAGYWEAGVGLLRASERDDYVRMRTGMERLAWLGRDSPRFYVALSRLATQRGDGAQARRELERSLALYPTAEAWYVLGNWHEKAQDWRQAGSAYANAIALDANDAGSHYRLGVAWLRLGEPARARDALARAAVLVPNDRRVQKSLARAEKLLRERSGEPAAPSPEARAAGGGSHG